MKKIIGQLATDESIKEDHLIRILQNANKLLLTEYCIQIDPAFRIYPLEVESYYYHDNFPDQTVHRNELQKNRFGKFYFHRKGYEASNLILSNRGGVDICLSNSDDFFYSILIRSARINDEEHAIDGPQKLAQRIYARICNVESVHELSEDNQSDLKNFEMNVDVLVRSELRDTDNMIHSTRIGIKEEIKYSQYNLRSIIDLKYSGQKEKDVLAYLRHHPEKRTLEVARELLGYNSKWIAEELEKMK